MENLHLPRGASALLVAVVIVASCGNSSTPLAPTQPGDAAVVEAHPDLSTETPSFEAGADASGSDVAATSCTLPAAVTFGNLGAFSAITTLTTLDPSDGISITRYLLAGLPDGGTSTHTCRPTLPACGDPSVVSLSNIVQDLADPDVKAALAASATSTYLVGQTYPDVGVWTITVSSGGSLQVGAPCPSPSTVACTPIPTGVERLAQDTRSLANAGLAQPACAGL